MVDNSVQLRQRIEELKRTKNAIILAHYYTSPEVQAVADFLGDSLALAIKARETQADVLLFAGVHFMAETAKVLCPEKTVLIPAPQADCSLAASCLAERFAAFKKQHPDHQIVSYVNTTVGIKALTDICCTSSNALKVVESIPEEQPIIFAPDRNLGGYIQKMTGRKNMVLWDGCCHVHDAFSKEGIERLKEEHPQAKVVVHPESREEVTALADFVGSTAAILSYCEASEAEEFIVVTEAGIITEMMKRMPDKRFIPAPNCKGEGANECEYMKMVTLENICEALENGKPEIVLEEPIRKAAERAILNMIRIK